MKEELEQQLEHDFPFMQKSRVKEERNTYKIFGCECGDGWYGLIHELCQSITDRYVKEEILPENIDLIMDVPLEVTVELGRTHKSIQDILDFAPGTIIELNKIAGEPIDVLVNGKYVAKGEVVVIEESFGIRITEIMK